MPSPTGGCIVQGMRPLPQPTAPARICPPRLLDERSRPGFREVYGALMAGSRQADVAVRRIRLAGVSLVRRELAGPRRLRVLLAEIDILTLTSEAEALAVRPRSRARLDLILELMESGTLEVRSAPLGGWAPDFSVFHYEVAEPTVLIGPHWLQRPYPHRGPALGCLYSDSAAARVGRRFSGLWEPGPRCEGSACPDSDRGPEPWSRTGPNR